jgi:hypothetical protein
MSKGFIDTRNSDKVILRLCLFHFLKMFEQNLTEKTQRLDPSFLFEALIKPSNQNDYLNFLLQSHFNVQQSRLKVHDQFSIRF